MGWAVRSHDIRRKIEDKFGAPSLDENSPIRHVSLDNVPNAGVYDVGPVAKGRAVPKAFQEMEVAFRSGVSDDLTACRWRLHVVGKRDDVQWHLAERQARQRVVVDARLPLLGER